MFHKTRVIINYIFFCLVMGVVAISCSDDTTQAPKPDSSTGVDKGSSDQAHVDQEVNKEASTTEGSAEDGAPDGNKTIIDCTSETDGTNCAPTGEIGFICLAGECKASICGDKFVDTSLNEECDDGNQDPSDGCSVCHWICTADPNCDDGETCNGAESCNTTTHLCQAGTPLADATACKMDTGADGECNGGVCGPAGCGNGVKAGTEECDDGNQIDGDGCNNDCAYSCHADMDCDDLDACNGVETCAMETDKQYCQAGTAPTCDDAQTCTTDTCDPATGCVYTPIDGDGDGKSCDDDCNDADAFVYVGAPECVDGKDNDCDSQVDEAPTVENVTCWEDYDKDGWSHIGATTATKFCGQACDPGYTSIDPADVEDCGPCVVDAHPKQTAWFTKRYCTTSQCGTICKPSTFDYNCDGQQTPRWTKISIGCLSISKAAGDCSGDGWVVPKGGTYPGCGVAGPWRTCTWDNTLKKCLTSEQARTQACH